MANGGDFEDRLTAVEREVAQLREQQGLSASDASAARMLAAGADHDVSEVRAELRAHTRAMNALRETQLEQGRRLDRIEGRFDGLEGQFDALGTRMTDGFATVGVGTAQIVTLLEGLDDR